jgi:hypothetical protein
LASSPTEGSIKWEGVASSLLLILMSNCLNFKTNMRYDFVQVEARILASSPTEDSLKWGGVASSLLLSIHESYFRTNFILTLCRLRLVYWPAVQQRTASSGEVWLPLSFSSSSPSSYLSSATGRTFQLFNAEYYKNLHVIASHSAFTLPCIMNKFMVCSEVKATSLAQTNVTLFRKDLWLTAWDHK